MVKQIIELEYEEVLERVKKMPIEECQKQLAFLLWALDRIEGNPIFWAYALGKYCRVYRRNYTAIKGVLIGVKLEPTEYTILFDEDVRDYYNKRLVHERSVLKIPAKSVLYVEPMLEVEDKGELRE